MVRIEFDGELKSSALYENGSFNSELKKPAPSDVEKTKKPSLNITVSEALKLASVI